jgi:S1-C subfamily serine protease
LFIDHPRIDLAALRIFPATNTWLPLSPTIPAVGEEVAAIGHPIGSKWSIEKGNVSNIRSTTHLQLTVGSQRGYSGSPAINKSGQVVGICSKGLVQIPTIVYFIRSDVRIELLDYTILRTRPKNVFKQPPRESNKN